MREEKVLQEPRRAVPIDARADVCVCGGGRTGVFAAARSARLFGHFMRRNQYFGRNGGAGTFAKGRFGFVRTRAHEHTSTRERTQKVYGNNGNNFEKTRFFV